jgi:hypothetical protein
MMQTQSSHQRLAPPTASAHHVWLIYTAVGVQVRRLAQREELLDLLLLTAQLGIMLSALANHVLHTESVIPVLLILCADGAPPPVFALRDQGNALSSFSALRVTGAMDLVLVQSASAPMQTVLAHLPRRNWRKLNVLHPTRPTPLLRRTLT